MVVISLKIETKDLVLMNEILALVETSKTCDFDICNEALYFCQDNEDTRTPDSDNHQLLPSDLV